MGQLTHSSSKRIWTGMIVTAIAFVGLLVASQVGRTFTARQFYQARYAATMTSGYGTAQDVQMGSGYMPTSSRMQKVLGAGQASDTSTVFCCQGLSNFLSGSMRGSRES